MKGSKGCIKERVAEASWVTLGVWADKCQETKDAREYTQHWKDMLEAFHQDNIIWLKEREHVVEDYEVLKKTIDFLQKDMDGYRAKLNGLMEFCNWLAQDMPWRLRDAVEELNQDNTHPAVVSFVMLCEGMLKRFKVELEELKARKPVV